MSFCLVQEVLEQSALRSPNKTALVCDGRRVTYAELNSLANRCARALVDRGVQPGDRVAIYLPNSIEFVVGMFGTLKAGAVFVPIHPATKFDKLRYILTNCRARAVMAEVTPALAEWMAIEPCPVPSVEAFFHCGKPAKPGASKRRVEAFAELVQPYADNDLQCERRPEDLACLIYTSGSTGEPKGVMSDHGNVLFASGSIISYLGNVESDVVLSALPLSFDYGLYQVLMTFRFGGTLILEKAFTFPAATLKLIEREKVTGFPGVPTMFSLLVQMDLTKFDLSSLRYLTNTAAALPPSHILELRRKFPKATLFSMYGLTETKRTLYLPPEELERRPGSVGIPIPGTEGWIEDDEGQRLGPGRVGELVVRGRHVMRGYWEEPEMTARRFRDHADPSQRICRTGDLFKQDEEGFFYFVGRRDDIIKSRGEKVAPREVENVLYSTPGVIEAAVVGIPDSLLGEAIKAFVVVEDSSVTMQSILAHCRRNLEDLMVPKCIEIRDELPKSSNGKIDKRRLLAESAS